MDREQLADFLRHRRENLRPEDVGLRTGARRRVAGLRRTEVAELTGMSADYYRAHVAGLRAAYGLGGPASRAGQMVRALQKESAEFATLWERHEVARRFEDHKLLIHPEVGAIEFDCQALITEDQSQALLILTAAPRTEAADKVALLRVLGQEQFTS